MKGLELSLRFYQEYGAPMIHERFPHIEHLLAIGLAGSGSECFGYDDVTSRDHDFEPGFCIFLPDEEVIDRKEAFALERAYAKLPREFLGFRRAPLDPVGGSRHGVIRMSDFFRDKTGDPEGNLTLRDWFSLPEQSLLEATNGRIFRDDTGALEAIRQRLSYLPEGVRRKKLAGHLLLMGQAGQYNHSRCLARNETAAAQLAVNEFVQSALHVIFLLNRRYLPYYKWSFRALRELPLLSHLHAPLEELLCGGNAPTEIGTKQERIEQICQVIVEELYAQELSRAAGSAMEAHAYAVNDTIKESEIRNLHVLFAV